MAVGLPAGQGKAAVHDFQPGCLVVQQIKGQSDIRYPQITGVLRAVPQIVARLGAGKGDGDGGTDGAAQNRAGVSVNAGGNVAGYHRAARAGLEQLHRQCGVAGDGPGQPHAKQGVHIAVADGQQQHLLLIGGTEILQRSAAVPEPLLHGTGVGGHTIALTDKDSPNGKAPLHQQPGGGDAVAAVVAGAAEYGHPAALLGWVVHHGLEPFHFCLVLVGEGFALAGDGHQQGAAGGRRPQGGRRQQIFYCVGHRRGRLFHQLQRWDAPFLNGNAIQLLHLGSRGRHPAV